MNKPWIFIAATISLAVLPLRAAEPEGKPVHYRTFGPGKYQSFVMNWDEQKQPVLYARIQTPLEWKEVLHPAPVMGQHRPFEPDADFYKKEQLLVVSRVVPGFHPDKALQVESVRATKEDLVLRYRYVAPPATKDAFFKTCLYVAVPQHDYKRVVFIENGKPVGELKAGEVRSPAPAAR